jgi:hypothetical protein
MKEAIFRAERFGEYRTRRLILEAWERIKGKR